MILSSKPILHSRQPLLLLMMLLLVLSIPAPATHSAAAAQTPSLEELWIDMRIGAPLIPLFNQAARSDDIARVEHPSQVDQLAGIDAGRKMVIFKSIEETEQFLQDMAGEIDIIGYNLEHGQTTPAAEKEDPVRSIQRMRSLADEYGLQLAFGPDHDFALSHGVEMAPYVDIFVLQIQRQQTNPATVKAFIAPLVPQLREANPDLEVSVQVRTEGDVEGIIELLDELKVHLDGVSILTSPDTVDIAWELTAALRPYVQAPSQGLGQTWIYILLAATLAGGAFLLYRRKTTNN